MAGTDAGGLPVVGMVGAGQLARMTHAAAIGLGQSLRILAANSGESAALVAADVQIGDYRDLPTLRAFAEGCTALTFDHEHVPHEHLRVLAAEGVAIYPPPDALIYAQDKVAMRQRLDRDGLPVPPWAQVHTADAILSFGENHGWPVVAKAPTGGYDGRGVWIFEKPPTNSSELTFPLLVEEKVPLVRELAAVVARSPHGQVAAWPVVETVQVDGICTEVLAPAPFLTDGVALEAQNLAIDIAHALGVVGVLAVELFELDGPRRLVVNELAMRPHNSAHWTLEGSHTSQFEQHLRAVLDYPLGPTHMAAPVVVMANILGGEETSMSLDERLHHLFAADAGAKPQLYGKTPRPGRKLGHVTILDDDLTRARARARAAAQLLGNSQADSSVRTHVKPWKLPKSFSEGASK